MSDFLVDLIPWIDAIGRSLLHFVWQGVLIGLLYMALRPMCATIASRYRLGMATLLLMITAPLLTMAWLHPVAGRLADPIVSAVANAVPVFGSAVDATSNWTAAWHWEQMLPWLVVAWLLGVSLIATRSFLHWHRLARVVRSALPLPRDWQMRLIQLRQQFGVLRPVRLLSSIHIATPTLIGWIKPAILLPASLLSGFTPAQIELIIAHELSHVRRFDYIANLVQVVIETLLFYHPVVYLVSRDVRQARESCCDDLVLTLGRGDAIVYARTLADLEELHNDFGPVVPALGMGGGLLLARIRRIVDPSYASALDPLPRGNGITLPIIVACAGLVLALMRMHLIPATLVDALMPNVGIDSPPDRTALVLNVPSIASVIAVRAVLAPAVSAPPMPTQAVVADSRAEPVGISAVAATTPQLAVPTTDSTVGLNLPVASVRPPVIADGAGANPQSSAPPVARAPAGPEATQVTQARYPIDALRNGVTGKVDLDFRIAADGSVRDVRVMHAQPSGVFEQAATAALRQWHFKVTDQSDLSRRYARSFAFARADTPQDACREVTGSHICRKQSQETPEN